MKSVMACLISLLLLMNVSYCATLPNANSLFEGSDSFMVDKIDESMGEGFNAILLVGYKIGTVVAVIVAVILAIKLMLTTPSKKAEVKQSMVPFLIGLLFLIAGVSIAIEVIKIFTTIF